MKQKIYPKINKEWAKYLTIENYFTYNEIEYRKNKIEESNCNFEEILEIIQKYRNTNKNTIFEFESKKFYFVETNKLNENIEKIKNFWKSKEYFFQKDFSFELIKETLIYEGFYSSTIEGAHSTIKRAQTLAKGEEKPKNRDENMIFNNFKALMEFEKSTEEITHKLIKKVHKITTKNTLENINDIGEYRSEPNEIVNEVQKVIFTPPSNMDTMLKMLDKLLMFLKPDEWQRPIDNIYKAIAFHFLFAYIHPFIDGNGRTVRVLFTYLLKLYEYDMFYYISLSEIIYKQKAKGYYKAFLDVERSGNNEFDMTYFFYYMVDIMLEGLETLRDRINTNLREKIIKMMVKDKKIDLTPRQKKLIKILSNKKISFMLTSEDLSKRLNVTVRTIQRDLKLLIDFDLVERIKAPKQRKYYFRLKIKL